MLTESEALLRMVAPGAGFRGVTPCMEIMSKSKCTPKKKEKKKVFAVN